MPVPYQPAHFHSVTPYIIVAGATQAVDFYVRAFGAQEVLRLVMPDGKIGHAELKIGDSHIMIADEFPEMGAKSPAAYGGSPISLLIYVPNVDKLVEQAVAAGAVLERPVQNQFYGDRSGVVVDPFGHKWSIATHIEDVSNEECQRRFAEMLKR